MMNLAIAYMCKGHSAIGFGKFEVDEYKAIICIGKFRLRTIEGYYIQIGKDSIQSGKGPLENIYAAIVF